MRQPMRSILAGTAVAAALAGAAPADAAVSCADPVPTAAVPAAPWERRPPSDVNMDAAALQEALDWAVTHTSLTALVIRHGCLVAESRLDPITAELPLDGWSMTKSATSMVAGRAVALGLFDLDEPIGALFPEADADHAALTPRHLLTMTSGMEVNWVRDVFLPQPDRVRDALSLPFEHAPGTRWQYAQTAVDLVAQAIERSVATAGYAGFQDFAHQELFAPLGIASGSWTWQRDRAGNTQGWAHLEMRSQDWARLGQLMLNGGRWNGEAILSQDYVGAATSPVDSNTGYATDVNDAYGFLFWLNTGDSYVLPDVQGPDAGEGPLLPSAPRDTFLMAGSGEQRVYVIPSRDLVVVRLGERGSREGDTRISVWTGRAGELDNELIRRVMLAVTDVEYTEDPGPYAGSEVTLPPPDAGILGDAQDTEAVLGGLALGSGAPHGCTPLGCE